MTVNEYLEKLEKLEKHAVPHPWDNRCREFSNHEVPKHIRSEYGWIARCEGIARDTVPNALFIAESRTAIPILIKLVKKYRDALEEIERKTQCRDHTADHLIGNIKQISGEALSLTLEDLEWTVHKEELLLKREGEDKSSPGIPSKT